MPPEAPANTEERALEGRTGPRRLFELDALRGLAAFTVIWHHWYYAFYPVQPPAYWVPFFAGHQAVVLFFVLSGYVLSIPYWHGRQLPLRVYYVRRFFRIYVPFLGALALAWLFARHFLYSRLGLSPWFHLTWQTPLTPHLLVQQLLISQNPDINTAFWSLRYEVEASVLFPFFCWAMRRMRNPVVVAAIATLYLAGALCGQLEISRTLMALSYFLSGALLARRAGAVQDWFHHRSRAAVLAIFVVSLGLYYYGNSARHIHLPWAGQGLIAVGAAGILLCALHLPRFSDALRTSVPEYLGRISYSLYLVHGTILFALIDTAYGHLGPVRLLVLYPLICLAAAHLFCIGVEEPSMKFGKLLADRLGKRTAPSKVLTTS